VIHVLDSIEFHPSDENETDALKDSKLKDEIIARMSESAKVFLIDTTNQWIDGDMHENKNIVAIVAVDVSEKTVLEGIDLAVENLGDGYAPANLFLVIRNFNDIVTIIQKMAFEPIVTMGDNVDIPKDKFDAAKQRLSEISARVVEIISMFPDAIIFNDASNVYFDMKTHKASEITSYEQYYDLVKEERIIDFFKQRFPDTLPFDRMPVQAYREALE
jgi:hypothetical protein